MLRSGFDLNGLRMGASLLVTSLTGMSFTTFNLVSTPTEVLADEVSLAGRLRLDAAPSKSVYRLTEGEWSAMKELQSECDKVAAGTRKSTTFDLDVALILGKDSFGAEDLGVEPVIEVAGNPSFNPEATAILQNRLAASIQKIYGALLSEGPISMAWVDKTANSGVSMEWTGASENGAWRIGIQGVKLTLVVADDCAGNPSTEVSDDAVNRIQGAIAAAQSVVDANEEKTTSNRLQAYCDAICDLTSYDHAAAANYSTPYGSQWQLTSVLDGDTGTKSVCEGYSKAFRLMTELSQHTSGTCILVTGTMQVDGGAAEAHMWNIVHMPDGRNYLVDVTNTDAGTIGASGGLFIASSVGSPESGYTFTTGSGRSVSYAYDSETLVLYTREVLTLADTPYVENLENEDVLDTSGSEAGEASNPANDSSKWDDLNVGDTVTDDEGNEFEVTVIPDGDVDYTTIATVADLIDAGFQLVPVDDEPSDPSNPSNPDSPDNPDTPSDPSDPAVPSQNPEDSDTPSPASTNINEEAEAEGGESAPDSSPTTIKETTEFEIPSKPSTTPDRPSTPSTPNVPTTPAAPATPNTPSSPTQSTPSKTNDNTKKKDDKGLLQTGGDEMRVVVAGSLITVAIGGAVYAYTKRNK